MVWKKSFLDSIIYFSFDQTGFRRHSQYFSNENLKGDGIHVLITGGTSGIGLATAEILARKGCHLILLGRDKEKGKKAVEKVQRVNSNVKVSFYEIDLSEKKSIYELPIKDLPDLDVLVNNAGGMFEELTKNFEGKEKTWQTHLVGHFLLTERLIGAGKINNGARIIFVSSGGAYLQKLDLSDLHYQKKSYSRLKSYANAKRAQIILTMIWQKKYGHRFLFSAMHPGWVDTPGVKEKMPFFYRWTKKRLRIPCEGADTIVWLALTQKNYAPGSFWFDRKKVPPHFFSLTQESEKEREELIDLLEREKSEK